MKSMERQSSGSRKRADNLPSTYLYDYLDLSDDIWYRLSTKVKPSFFIEIWRARVPSINVEVTFTFLGMIKNFP